ncbi:MAG TPA: M20/M25/M40 family metallo-hydrolase [Firmicutes bacterium]|nr:M20/M25/M40 family metallo-hydrolase [Bacillota bacterium]
MSFSAQKATLFLESKRRWVEEMLCDLIAIPSLPGQEGAAMRYMEQRMKEIPGRVEEIALSDKIKEDPDYSSPIEDLTYEGRANLLVKQDGTKGKTVILNTHLDTVPPSPGQDKAFSPEVQDGAVFGRGACDAKGQAVTMALVAAAVAELGPFPAGVDYHFVVEEECGGNGTLAMIRRECRADACIVLEPSVLTIQPSVRGAVWFDVTCYGRSGHSGRAGDVVSALKKAVQAMNIMEEYHAALLGRSREVPLFSGYANPMPITFGEMHAGNWPASAPNTARFRGVMGFLPNVTKEEVMAGLRSAVAEKGDAWLRDNFDMKFIYRHDSSVTAIDHPLVQGLKQACTLSDLTPQITAMTASCDAWFYRNQLDIPTVVFGPGDLKYAHSREEQIAVDEILKAAQVLVTWLATAF